VITNRPPEQYLIDASAHARICRLRSRELWEEALGAGRIALCAPTETGILGCARSLQEYEECAQHLRDLYAPVAVPQNVWQELQRLLAAMADNGCHRSAGIEHLLVALTARHHGLTVLHHDPAFDTIAKHTDLRTRWLAEPGGLH
jgi:predicted nucleic acid-binding protein